MSLHRIENILNMLNAIGYTCKGMNRLAYSENELNVKENFSKICEGMGLVVRVDEGGNYIARRKGILDESPPVLVGSHLDTVINGGKYDGTVGIVAGLELISRLNEKKVKTLNPIEIICFAGEESSRFGISTIGSQLMAGKLNKQEISNIVDKNNITLRESFKNVGLDIELIEMASRKEEQLKAFFEVHIEQGPVLEGENISIGIVTGIAAPTRLILTVKGKSGHSGSTPMNLRKDAFLAASELALFLEEMANLESDKGTVATVGDCVVAPGAMNVIPGKTEMKIDIRSPDMNSKNFILKQIKEKIIDVEKKRGLSINCEILTHEDPVVLGKDMIKSLIQSCEKLNISYKKMPSGAGHDAMNMAGICPTGLIFIPCRDGLSHHKDEYTSIENIKIGCDILEEEILKWAT